MAHKSFEVMEFLGVDRNRVRGQSAGTLAPSRLFNLVPDRQGGYTPFGRRVDKGVTITNLANLIGFDENGLASLSTVASGAGKLQLLRGTTVYDQDSPAFPDIENASHLDQVGAFISRDKFLVRDRDGNIVSGALSLSVSSAAGGGSDAGGTDSAGTARINAIVYGNNRWLVGNESGEIWELAEGNEDWVLRFSAGESIRSLAYGDSTFVAAGFTKMYWAADNDTGTWTEGTLAGHDLDGVGFKGVTYLGDGIFLASGSEIFRSTNSGRAWTEVDDTFEPGVGLNGWWHSTHRPANFNGLIFAVTLERNHSLGNYSRAVYWSADNGVTWNYELGGGASEEAYHMDVDSAGRFAYVTQSGAVWSATTAGAWTKNADNLAGGGALRDIRYNPVTNSWFAVGDNGTLLESQNLGSWTPPRDDVDSSVDLWAVGIGPNGEIMVGGTNGTIYSTGSGTGLPAGEYKVTTLAYFNTRAGKFTFSLQTVDMPLAARYGNTIDVIGPTREKFVRDTMEAWGMVYDDPAYADAQARLEAVAQGVRVDVYLRYNPNAIGNQEQVEESFESLVNEPVTVYDFTATLESGSSAGTTTLGVIDEAPLGSQLGGGQGVTTLALQEPETALHAGRMWGMAAQDASRYANDDVSLEIANVFGDFVLCYSEPGWANLLRPDNYLPLRPTQSTTLTGILSTPAGLMVFFDNEVFVVDGDPVVGTLQYALYPDIVGNDEGATPCKLGGVPFCVWKGEVYALVGGQAQRISDPIYRADDPVVRIAPEPQETSLLCLTASGEVFRYDTSRQFWSNNVVSGDVAAMLPDCNCVDGDNTVYANAANALFVARRDGEPDTPEISYRGIDCGVPRDRKAFYRVRLPIDGLVVSTDRADPDWAGVLAPLVPRVYFNRENEDDVEDAGSTDFVIANRLEELFDWRLPLGRKSRFIDLRFELRSMSYESVVTPVLEIVFADQGGSVR